ncbi:MAG: serine/threonine-protein kinase [Polyangiaceae bacterium]
MPDLELPHDVPSMAGEVVAGKYRVDKLIGTGGMGTVWLGAHASLGTPVAIKFIRPAHASQPDARKRFEIEAQAAAKLKSKHAVQVFDYGVTDAGIPYIVMEYLEGESLSDLLIRKGPLAPKEVASIIRQAARALEKAHNAGIVHRDLKPDNIFLATNVEEGGSEGSDYVVKLVDFGIAKIFMEPLTTEPSQSPMGGPTQDGAVIGTPNFMSPEQLTIGGAPGRLTDLWSLGACTFAAMLARIPFEGEVLGDIVLKVCAAPLPVPSKLNPDVPMGFDAWFAKACSRDPKKRFQTAKELSDALDNVCGVTRGRMQTFDDDQVQFALKPATPEAIAALEELEEQNRAAMSPKTALLAGLVLGVAAMVAIIGFLAWRDKQRSDLLPPPPPVLTFVSADGGAINP